MTQKTQFDEALEYLERFMPKGMDGELLVTDDGELWQIHKTPSQFLANATDVDYINLHTGRKWVKPIVKEFVPTGAYFRLADATDIVRWKQRKEISDDSG